MRRFSILIMTLMLGLAASAQPINTDLARKAGTNFLLSKGLITQSDTLNLAINYAGDNGKFDCFYVFNVADGFVIVSADIRCVPILGYSFNGNFIWNSLPENFEDWLEGYRADIERGILANAPANDSLAHEWKLLIDGNFKPSPAPKDDTYLLTSTWEQGSGYNNYCPVMDGDHVVVGCVATSMAQIIRYWGYPSHPFGKSSYRHSTYGGLILVF